MYARHVAPLFAVLAAGFWANLTFALAILVTVVVTLFLIFITRKVYALDDTAQELTTAVGELKAKVDEICVDGAPDDSG